MLGRTCQLRRYTREHSAAHTSVLDIAAWHGYAGYSMLEVGLALHYSYLLLLWITNTIMPPHRPETHEKSGCMIGDELRHHQLNQKRNNARTGCIVQSHSTGYQYLCHVQSYMHGYQSAAVLSLKIMRSMHTAC